jgi:hypothetical protein
MGIFSEIKSFLELGKVKDDVSKRSSPFKIQFNVDNNPYAAFFNRDTGRHTSVGGGTHHVVIITLKNHEDIYHIKEIGLTDSLRNEHILWQAKIGSQWIEMNRSNNKVTKRVKITVEMNLPVEFLWVKTEDGRQFFSDRLPPLPEIRESPT